MHHIYKFFIITLAVTSIAMAGEPLNNTNGNSTALSPSPDVSKALDDAMYLAAKENLVNPTDQLKKPNLTAELNENSKTIKSSRDPVMQMVAVGLGVAAAMMVMNYFSGGTSTSGSFSGFSSAMLGGMIGDYAYRKYYAPPLPSVPTGIAQRISP